MKTYFHKLLITGGHGQMAKAIKAHPLALPFDLTLPSHQAMDITNESSLQQAIDHVKPDCIINTAAYTAVDKAESERELALAVNQIGAQKLALACHKNNIPLIQLSTDYVFSGEKKTPYEEDDVIHPINVYGESKYLGEEAIRTHCADHLILRVSGVFSEFGQNFLKTILRLARERDELNIVSDQITSPTYAGDIAGVLFTMLQQNKFIPGTYHYCSQDAISWYEFAGMIVNTAKKRTSIKTKNIHPINANEYKTAAKRPPYSVLDCRKIKTIFDITQPAVLDGIVASLRECGN